MKRSILVFSLLLFAGPALAETGFQFAAPGVRAPDDPNVGGMRFALLHGRNSSVRGVDLGLLSLSETGDLSGFQGVLGMGKVTGRSSGLASSLINIHTGTDSGVNAAFINRINTMQSGANIGFVNIADDFTLVDIGGVNVSNRSTVQLGFVNVTKRIKGVQLGFLNVAENGFLPVFPFFNFPKN